MGRAVKINIFINGAQLVSRSLSEISLECARGARFGPHNHVDSTNRGFILTIDRSPQQSDRRFRRYTVLRRHWTGITSICAHKVRQGEARSRANGRMETKTIACASGSSSKLGIKLRQREARKAIFFVLNRANHLSTARNKTRLVPVNHR